jgi:hypothetical protein
MYSATQNAAEHKRSMAAWHGTVKSNASKYQMRFYESLFAIPCYTALGHHSLPRPSSSAPDASASAPASPESQRLGEEPRFLGPVTARQRLAQAFGLLPHPHPKPFTDRLIGKLATLKFLIQP